jgi:hypothetical protein
MRRIAFLLLVGLAACATQDAVWPAGASSALSSWQEASGKPPTQVEFAALVAACEDRAGRAEIGGQIGGCLTDLGLRRMQ